MSKSEIHDAIKGLMEYMTISEIAFHAMAGTWIDDKNLELISKEYKENHDELLKVLVNNFG